MEGTLFSFHLRQWIFLLCTWPNLEAGDVKLTFQMAESDWICHGNQEGQLFVSFVANLTKLFLQVESSCLYKTFCEVFLSLKSIKFVLYLPTEHYTSFVNQSMFVSQNVFKSHKLLLVSQNYKQVSLQFNKNFGNIFFSYFIDLCAYKNHKICA